jgi:molybdate transport system substrate-binding protein
VRFGRILVAAFFAAACSVAGGSQPLSIAAAANLTHVIGALDAEFAAERPGVDVTVALGSSGGLVAQMGNGAPFDVFLSADMEFPAALARAGHADAASLTPFAVGRLVLWTVKPGVDVSDVGAAVRSPAVHSLAVANTATAPYGRAARQALESLGLWTLAQAKLVTAEDISQTAQFVETGNADAGFVALSSVMSPKLRDRGRWIEVPAALYRPIVQGAIITTHGSGNPVSAAYIAFLRGDAARRVLEAAGYGVPAGAPAGK